MPPSLLRTNAPDEAQRIADALAGLAVPPDDVLSPPPKNRVAAAPGETGSALAQALFPYIGGKAFAPQPPVSMTPSAAPPIESPTPAGVIEPNRMWGVPPAETLPPEGATGGKFVPPGQNQGALGLAGDLANIAGMMVGGPEAAVGGAGKAIIVAASKMRDRGALQTAQKMAAKGASPDEIWATVRRFQDAGGNWSGEIPDLGSKMRRLDPTDFSLRPLSQHFEHPELYERVPRMADLPTSRMSPQIREFVGPNTLGFMEPGRKPRLYYSGNPAQARSTVIHEGGHAVADLHGLPAGASGSPVVMPGTPAWDIYKARLSELLQEHGIKPGSVPMSYELEPLKAKAQQYAAMTAYYNSAGEAASRAMQARADWPLKKLEAISPRATMEKDVPYEHQIVTYGKPRQ